MSAEAGFTMGSDPDRRTHIGDQVFPGLIPAANDPPEIVIRDAGYFLRPEKMQDIARQILGFMAPLLIGSSIWEKPFS